MSGPSEDAVVCTSCAALNPRSLPTCVQCGSPLRPALFDPTKSRRLLPQPPPPDVGRGLQFSLGSLMLFITVCAICLGLMSNHPGLGIFLAIVSLPALIRTALLTRRREQLGRPLDRSDQIVSFLGSAAAMVGAAVVLSVVAMMTFFFVCFCALSSGPTANQSAVIYTIIGVGILFGLWIVSWMVRWAIRRWSDDTH